MLELHAHGGPAVLRTLSCAVWNWVPASRSRASSRKRAFLNGKMDLAQAEGVADLIDAATATAARAAARSLSGAFSREIRALADALIELRMYTEATLDFPDEDLDFLRATDARVDSRRSERDWPRYSRGRHRARCCARASPRCSSGAPMSANRAC